MPPVGFEPTISAGERPQTYALDRAATGIGKINILDKYIYDLQLGWHPVAVVQHTLTHKSTH